MIDEVTAIDTGKSKFTPKKLGVYEILGSTSVIGYDDSYDYEGDFLLTARVGANAGELYRYSGKVKISDNTVFIKGEQLDFIYYALLHFDIKRLSFGTGQPLVKASELKVQDIMMPVDDDERSAIGTYFSNLDNLITLHQWKHYRIKKIINSAWEQRKLGDLGTIQTCKRIFKDQTSESGEIPFYKNGTIGLKADAFISREIFEEYKLLYPYPEKGDILISAVGSVGRTAEYTGEDEYFQDSNVVWLKTDNSIDKKYLKVFYQVIKWLIEGSTVKHLYNDNILKSEIVFPYSLDEQRKIGEYFDSLDHLITLHQQKYKSLKKLKKFMVKNMFLQVKCKNTEKDR